MEKESLSVFGRLRRFEDIEAGNALAFIPIPDPEDSKMGIPRRSSVGFETDPTKMPDAAREVLGAFAGVLKSYNDGNAGEFSIQCQTFPKYWPRPRDRGWRIPPKYPWKSSSTP